MAPGNLQFCFPLGALSTAGYALLAFTAGISPAAAAEASRPAPRIVRIVAPIATPNRVLEEALRLNLFPVSVLDGQGHGPDPGSAEWRQAEAFQRRRACQQAGPLRYAYNRIDLNANGQNEVVATVIGPYTCGTGGCTAYVFENDSSQGKGLRLVSKILLFNPPLMASEQRHNGWRDLISRVHADPGQSTYAVLRFEGSSYTYPSNPSVPPAEPLRQAVSGMALLDTNNDASPTHLLRCDRRGASLRQWSRSVDPLAPKEAPATAAPARLQCSGARMNARDHQAGLPRRMTA
ncbi:hypothetical protein KQ304_09820 [Synechococcus sp. CS-1329]|uniref:hypothetical protein n=1 Tax=Synechococcus sp. CS-1329 TaxID=2847975 RepID=UPI00223C3064|nr:hypothetical protein [Synechococcus sp. CS-1329]MCT0219292.1 hypothetical protein [Synechococcus sp. CS-1329]